MIGLQTSPDHMTHSRAGNIAGDFEIMMFHPQNEYTISPGVATLAIMTHTHTHVQSVLGHWSLFIGSGETCAKRRSKEAVWELKSKYNTTRNSECRLCHDVTHNKLVYRGVKTHHEIMNKVITVKHYIMLINI